MPKAAKKLLMVCVLGFGVLACEKSSVPDPKRPNVLLVTIDTLRADHVGAYGAKGVETPTLDTLAAQGVRFANAYSTAPTTLVSHTSILTGLYPTRHGVRHNVAFRAEAELTTLAERLQLAGYDTAAVLGAFILAKQFGLDQGFEFYDDEMSRVAGPGGYAERTANEVTESATTWLEKRHKKPFFLWVHYYDPHADYQPPSPYKERYANRRYAGEIAFVDEQLGLLFETLRERKQSENTLIIVTSDHGESLGEHGELTHAYTLYDATLAVPLIVRGPQIPEGWVVEPVVSTAGITPTVLSLLGQSMPSPVDGLDLSQFWKKKEVQELPPAYAETLSTQLVHGWAPLFALRSQQHLYVRAPRAELYDVQRDPRQIANQLEGERREAALRLAQDFDAKLETLLSVQRVVAPSSDVEAETLQQLAKLGYAAPVAAEALQNPGMDPKDGLQWLMLMSHARTLFYENDLEGANREMTVAIEHLSDSVEALGFKAKIDLQLHRLEDARRYAEKAARLAPHAVELQVIFGVICKEMGDEARAVEVFRAIEQTGAVESMYAQANIMWTYAREGKLEEAELREKRAREFAPTEQGMLELGKAWEHVGEYERALNAYRLALESFPASETVQMMLAIQMARLGEDKASAEHLARAGKAAQDPIHLNRLGIVYAARGDFRQAEKVFVEILAQHPEYLPAQSNLQRVRSPMQ